MAQFLRPSAVSGSPPLGWTANGGATLASVLAEAVADDNTSYDAITAANALTVELSDVGTPIVRTGHVMRMRSISEDGEGDDTIAAALMQGAATIKTLTMNCGLSYATSTVTLSEAEAGNITDYNALTVVFTPTFGSGTALRLTWFEMEIPGNAKSSGLTLLGVG